MGCQFFCFFDVAIFSTLNTKFNFLERAVTAISLVSYSLYLTNLSLFNVVYKNYTAAFISLYVQSTVGHFLYYFIFVIFALVILYLVIEKLFLYFRNKYVNKKIQSA